MKFKFKQKVKIIRPNIIDFYGKGTLAIVEAFSEYSLTDQARYLITIVDDRATKPIESFWVDFDEIEEI